MIVYSTTFCPDNVWVESMNRKSLLNCERYIFDCEDLFPASLGALRIIGKFSLLIFKRQTYHSLQNLTKFHTKVVMSNFRLYGMVRWWLLVWWGWLIPVGMMFPRPDQIFFRPTSVHNQTPSRSGTCTACARGFIKTHFVDFLSQNWGIFIQCLLVFSLKVV